MRRIWKSSLGLSFGLLVSAAQAGEPQWRTAAPPALVDSSPAVSIGPPAAALGTPVARTAPLPENTSLTQPVPMLDNQLRTASFTPLVLAPTALPASDTSEQPRPMPTGAVKATETSTTKPQRLEPEPVPAPKDAQVPTTTVSPLLSPIPETGCISDGCTTSACDPCMSHWLGSGDCCFDQSRFTISGEYLLWWMKQPHVPPLITQGIPGTLSQGELGPTSVVLFGGSAANLEPRSGARFTAGWWFDDDHTIGLEGSFFFLQTRTDTFSVSSGGLPTIGRPFFDVTPPFLNPLTGMLTATNVEAAENVAAPFGVAGTAHVNLSNQLWSAEANLKTKLCCGSWYNIELLSGFRFLSLTEKLQIDENPTIVPAVTGFPQTPLFPIGTAFNISDRFSTGNYFYGGQIGARAELRCGAWGLDFMGKLALGTTQQTVNIAGNTVISSPGSAPVAFQSGFLAVGSNSGRFSREMFTVVPELGVTVRYRFTECMSMFVGYNFLYWSNVVRAADQVDRVVNTTQVPSLNGGSLPTAPPNPARPMFAFHGSDFYAHGINVGLEFRY